MRLDELETRLRAASEAPPRPSRIVLVQRGRRTMQTAISENRAIEQAKADLAERARKQLGG